MAIADPKRPKDMKVSRAAKSQSGRGVSYVAVPPTHYFLLFFPAITLMNSSIERRVRLDPGHFRQQMCTTLEDMVQLWIAATVKCCE
jgi:hypothetical protein